MHKIPYTNFHYLTEKRPQSKLFPSLNFYLHLFCIVYRASRLAKRGRYDGSNWMESSYEVMQQLEKVGIRVEISGIENVVAASGPVVIIGNHMSMMETLLLPVMIQPIKPVTFVVKDSLLSYPVFKYVMRSRNPITVTRTNPRQDLKTVLNEGLDRLQHDISIIVFPQTTRSHTFDPNQMSSIGVKLAKKAEVAVVPLALKTDCWQNGKKIKDFGKLDVTKKAHFAFGEPVRVKGKGDEEHAAINAFIAGKLQEWEGE
ncbi:1-acyl-sn-glycerol-3-phosphate acyltransferase [Desulfopila sp. IMCC35006]|uniref:lysophospholipid acyltransferase family protein n=1 Tax=Desulfopila sp. IMCC35006 TaxID=2569542 RepID=UPI0010ABC8F4|nr:lysophospholipid acyltransferase family protein [Desulfopila sp. IMCC35006]TKB27022.1 1-acyl-sn-glycerol-3-phosphate acyltransferase [Desulfopila sp. IMCC35006]